MAGRPGPVYLSVPSNLARQEEGPAASSATRQPLPRLPPRLVGMPAEEELARAAAMIAEARRPLALVGIAADAVAIRPALLRWLAATGVPVATTPKAKGLVPEDHPAFVATSTGMAGDKLFVRFLQSADLLIGIGFDPVEAIRPFYTESPFLSIADYSLAEPRFMPALELLGDVPATLDALRERVHARHGWEPDEVRAFRQRLIASLTPAATRTQAGLSPAYLFTRLRSLVPRDTIVTVDTGAHKLLLGQIWQAWEPRSYLVSHGLSTMGYALPAALAAKLERPDRPVVAVTGDGGLAMALAELETAVRLGLPVVVVVLSDRSLHLIRLHQERWGVLPQGVDFGPIDFAGIAPGFGARGVRTERWTELDDAVTMALRSDRPTLIEVPVDPGDYARML